MTSPRRLERVLPWLGLAILLAGAIVFFASRHGDASPTRDLSKGKVRGGELVEETRAQKTAHQQALERRFEPAARTVTANFVRTAIRRKHLDLAREYASPGMLSAVSKADWLDGSLPVVPFPYDLQTVSLKVDTASARHASVQVALLPKRNDVRGVMFAIDLSKYGKGSSARWLVDSAVPRTAVAVKSLP